MQIVLSGKDFNDLIIKSLQDRFQTANLDIESIALQRKRGTGTLKVTINLAEPDAQSSNNVVGSYPPKEEEQLDLAGLDVEEDSESEQLVSGSGIPELPVHPPVIAFEPDEEQSRPEIQQESDDDDELYPVAEPEQETIVSPAAPVDASATEEEEDENLFG